jgi:two-component system response regulator NreC
MVAAAAKLGVLLAIFDFPMLTAGLRALIDAEPDMAVVGQVESPAALADALTSVAPDVVVAEHLAVGCQGTSAMATVEQIRAARPTVRILALECRGSDRQYRFALRAGADGFLPRDAEPAEVLTALRSISRGEAYVPPAIVTQMVQTYVLRTPTGSMEDAYDLLSEREREVLLLAATGHTNREIARTVHLSEQTVHNYRAGVMEKLGFHDRVELLKFAVRRGIVSVADL